MSSSSSPSIWAMTSTTRPAAARATPARCTRSKTVLTEVGAVQIHVPRGPRGDLRAEDRGEAAETVDWGG
jgi:hypothetical protein